MKTASTAALEILLNLPTQDILIQQEVQFLKYLYYDNNCYTYKKCIKQNIINSEKENRYDVHKIRLEKKCLIKGLNIDNCKKLKTI